MGLFIVEADLTPFATIDAAKAAAMIEDAEAMALLAAPCLSEGITPAKIAAVKAILRGAILRWNEAGSGAFQQVQVGPFGNSLDTRQQRRAMFWPSEIEQLQALCASADQGKAFSVDTVGCGTSHLPWCSLMFVALYCSCGVDIAGEPIFELG